MLHTDIEQYLSALTPRRDTVLTSMERYARRHGFPIVGPQAGRFLYQMAAAIRAERILELGSGFGYSAYWFALATGKWGQITMTDTDKENRERAVAYFKKGRVRAKIDFILGDALETASHLKGPFDIVFSDVDKHFYPQTISIAADLLRPGGLFITDNILWSGRVYDRRHQDVGTRAVRTFTRKLYADTRFFVTVAPIRDGLAVALKR